MTPQDEYLDRVRRAMAGMEPSVRDDIVRELRSHIIESAMANGGNVGAALSALGSPAEVGGHYREVYGYSRVLRLVFAVLAFLVAIPSVPVVVVGAQGIFPFYLSIIFLVITAAWILWVSVASGSRTGLIAGASAFAARAVTFLVVSVTQPGAQATAEGVAILITASAMLVFLGWLPGTAKRTWSRPRAEL